MTRGRGLGELALLCAGVFLGALDQTVVVSALPAMIRELQIPFTQLDRASWIVTGYLLGYTAALPLAGQLADVLGPRRAYGVGLVLFFAGSVGCAAAPGLWPLVVARLVQAAGGGALVPAALAAASGISITRLTASGVALGAVTAVAEAGSMLGPLYGAIVAERFGWRAIFWLNLPIVALLAAGVGMRWRRRAAAGDGELTGAALSRIDWRGAAIAAAGLGALTLALSDEARRPRPMAITAGLCAAAVLLLTWFVLHERRASSPLLDVRLFRRAAFSAAGVVGVLSGAALIVPMVNVPLWAQTVAGRTTLDSGLLLLRLTVPIPVGAALGGLLLRRIGARACAALGLTCAGVGLALMGQWPTQPSDLRLSRDLALAGLGFGMIVPPLTAAAIGAAGPGLAGAASAVVTLARMIGMMIGLAALTTWGLRRFDALARGLPFPVPQVGENAAAYPARLASYQQQIVDATLTVYHDVFLAAAAIAGAALAPVLWLVIRRR
ncbi:MAG: MFS transporter [Chloroflexota bacterium]